ncbi:hypothetical protein BL808_001312 [Escherichia coli]|nr:hypothetical protein [Escherichia coli]EHD2019986.1 hypothetical protein [Escherichia coli]
MNESKYSQAFSIKKLHAKRLKHDKNQLSLEKAHEIRKFEIELYWKRTAYFWTLIAAIFAGYFLLASRNPIEIINNGNLFLIFIASIGFIFSFGWFLVNKGSKFWQENWEFHIDKLENEITGPLYKTVLHRDASMSANNDILDNLLAPKSFSVSKVNQFIAIYTMTAWVILMFLPSISLCNILFMAFFFFMVYYFMYKKSASDIKENEKPMKIKSINRGTSF